MALNKIPAFFENRMTGEVANASLSFHRVFGILEVQPISQLCGCLWIHVINMGKKITTSAPPTLGLIPGWFFMNEFVEFRGSKTPGGGIFGVKPIWSPKNYESIHDNSIFLRAYRPKTSQKENPNEITTGDMHGGMPAESRRQNHFNLSIHSSTWISPTTHLFHLQVRQRVASVETQCESKKSQPLPEGDKSCCVLVGNYKRYCWMFVISYQHMTYPMMQ